MQLLADLQERGLTVRIDGADLIVRPSRLLTDALRRQIRAQRSELFRLAARSAPRGALGQSEADQQLAPSWPSPAADLDEAINACCDARGDSQENRAGLIKECMRLSAAAQRDLISHFREQAAINMEATGGRYAS